MELPEYEDSHYGGTSYTILRSLRCIGFLVVVVLLGYSLWRIHVIEEVLVASDRFTNITRMINQDTRDPHRTHRVPRSTGNSFGLEDKELPRGSMLSAKNENPAPPRKKVNKEDFEYLVQSLFDKIQAMHNDNDRSHFDNNMKAVFKAWFPVFDALLPQEYMEGDDVRRARSAVKSSEESSEEKKPVRAVRSVAKSSEESSEEKKKPIRVIRSAKSSEESSEEQKHMEAGKNDAVSFTMKPGKDENNQKSSEESSEEKKERKTRSVERSSEESMESVEEQTKILTNRVSLDKKSSEESLEKREKEKLKDESLESSESADASDEMVNKMPADAK